MALLRQVMACSARNFPEDEEGFAGEMSGHLSKNKILDIIEFEMIGKFGLNE
jgi:hypothetical protein